jgi:hypothetical protein
MRPEDIVKDMLVTAPPLETSIVTYGNIYIVLFKTHRPEYAKYPGAEWQVSLQRVNKTPYKFAKVVGYGHLVPYLGFFSFLEGTTWDTETRRRTASSPLGSSLRI